LIGAADDFSYPERRPSSVIVAGSMDGTNYTHLATMIPAAPTSNLQIQEFSTSPNTTAFAHYRITFTPPISGTSLHSPVGQDAASAIDNNVTNKYLNFDQLNTGLTITPLGQRQRPVRALTL